VIFRTYPTNENQQLSQKNENHPTLEKTQKTISIAILVPKFIALD
jgi:hypothetical protein